MDSIPYFIVDAFTDRPFAGNPAAVVLLESWPQDAWLANVAMEMNLSETAFLVPRNGGFDLRWFTPKVEVDLCGHATLASAAALAHTLQLTDGATVEFSTRSGVLPVARNGSRFRLDFPATPEKPAPSPDGLAQAVGVSPTYVGKSKFDYLVEVKDAQTVREMLPDFRRLAGVQCRGVIVTAANDRPEFDFISRFFAPAAGIDEDPVTGSAHCCLAEFWGRRLGKTRMTAFQASARGGVVDIELRENRVILGGSGVVVAAGEFLH
ncbi:MAG TPA: PhzF family phenazine biosynthesis protein [Tepidisphaeraceae bacterium]|nr:PhzF family phenazine biosynthesis protein [Tepidisphaeraceae bacterium]